LFDYVPITFILDSEQMQSDIGFTMMGVFALFFVSVSIFWGWYLMRKDNIQIHTNLTKIE